jgi:hypothetical protein
VVTQVQRCGEPRLVERRDEVRRACREVRPAVVVARDHDPRAQDRGGCGGPLAVLGAVDGRHRPYGQIAAAISARHRVRGPRGPPHRPRSQPAGRRRAGQHPRRRPRDGPATVVQVVRMVVVADQDDVHNPEIRLRRGRTGHLGQVAVKAVTR